jgi:antitoxin component YwqK of YwqJK toxin-antitoxin module
MKNLLSLLLICCPFFLNAQIQIYGYPIVGPYDKVTVVDESKSMFKNQQKWRERAKKIGATHYSATKSKKVTAYSDGGQSTSIAYFVTYYHVVEATPEEIIELEKARIERERQELLDKLNIAKYYEKDGQLYMDLFNKGKLVETAECSKDRRRNGLALGFDENGKLKSKCYYVNDTLHGIFENYFEGRLSSRYSYNGGKKEGPYEEYLDNTLYMIGYFKNNQMDGPQTKYRSNGEIWEIIYFHEGRWTGPYELYYENGNLKEKGYYLKAKKHGTFYEYTENGKLKKTVKYKNGDKAKLFGI